MRGVRSTALKVVLALSPLFPTGCASWSNRAVTSRAPVQQQLNTQQLSMSTAKLEESRGHLDVAKRLYEEIRQQDPSNAECLHRLAVVYTRLNQHSAAELYFRQASTLNPNDPEILADMGYAAFVCKKYAESEALLEQSLRIRDGDQRTITNLAIARAWAGHDDASLAAFRRITTEPEALRNLAAIQVARGDKANARKSHDQAQIADSKRPNAANVIAQTAASDAARQQVVDVPPPPAAEFTQPVIPSSEPIEGSEAPLPPLPVISPYQHFATTAMRIPERPAALALPAATSCASIAIPPAPIAPNGAPAWAPATPVETAPVPPSSTDAPNSLDSVESTSQLPSPSASELPEVNLTTSVAVEVKEASAWIQHDNEIMFEPVAASVRVPEALPVDAPVKLEVKRPSAWRKTDAFRATISDDTPHAPNKPSGEKAATTSIPECDDEYSNVWNICLVTLVEEKRLVSAGARFSMEYQSQEYRFVSAEALEKFRAAPQQYAPVAGGLDVVAVRNGRGAMRGSLNFGLWHHRQLYLFSNAQHAEEFRRHPEKYTTAN